MSLKRKLGAGKLVVSPCKLKILISLEDGTAIEPDWYRLGFNGRKKAERSKNERKEEKWKKKREPVKTYMSWLADLQRDGITTTEEGVRVCGDAVLLDFWCGFAVIFILSCGIAVLQNQAVCGI